jgi:uncharacterized membrane protein
MANYRPPRESSYAKAGWWTAHLGELAGAIGGFLFGFLLLLGISVIYPDNELGWIPLVTLVVGALGVRAVVRRNR